MLNNQLGSVKLLPIRKSKFNLRELFAQDNNTNVNTNTNADTNSNTLINNNFYWHLLRWHMPVIVLGTFIC